MLTYLNRCSQFSLELRKVNCINGFTFLSKNRSETLHLTSNVINGRHVYFRQLGALPPTRTARQPPLAGAAPLAAYARQVPYVPCEY